MGRSRITRGGDLNSSKIQMGQHTPSPSEKDKLMNMYISYPHTKKMRKKKRIQRFTNLVI
jgi:hypothetical protein